MKTLHIIITTLLCLVASTAGAKEKAVATLTSPDGKARVVISRTGDGTPVFNLSIDGKTVLQESRMAFEVPEVVPNDHWNVVSRSGVEKHREVWRPLWGKRESVADCYNARRITFASASATTKGLGTLTYEVRLYNDGMAWRCINETAKKDDATTTWKDVSDFCFADDYTAWYYNGEYHNIGPERLSESEGERRPVMTVKADEGLYLALHEAYLLKGKPLLLTTERGSRRFGIVGEETATTQGDATAWRVVMYGRTPGDLVDSHLIELLNPEAESSYAFDEWVRPGTCLWDWRIDGAEWEGFHYGMNYESWVRMVDFAAAEGFTALVLDANWYGPEFEKDSDPITGEKARDVQRIIRYGREKGVGLWLYLNDVAGTNYPIEETLAQYEAWGAAGVKYGFMEGTMTERNAKTRRITELCAKHRLCVDFHDNPVHPWGQDRTWPNALTREYCQAQLDAHRTFEPKTFVTSVYVNMIAGPLDMNNGFFDLRQGLTTRVDNNQEVHSTVCAEAARTLITYSGATVIPDIPEQYRRHPQLLAFMSAQQQPWRESRTLAGEIGEYVVMMRQAADGRYLVAAATNEEARTVEIDLSFLPKGHYKARITQDAPEAHYLTNREVTHYEERDVKGGKHADTLTLTLQPGGGACVVLEVEG